MIKCVEPNVGIGNWLPFGFKIGIAYFAYSITVLSLISP